MIPPAADQIERELEILLARYEALERAARQAKAAFFVLIAAMFALIVFGYVVGNEQVIGMSMLILLFVVAIASLKYFFGARWIDAVSWTPMYGIGIKRTEAMAIEDMINEHRRTLIQLQSRHSL